jgi:probable F420-dependent oxidoreductase
VFERVLFPADQSGPHGLYRMPDAPWPDRYRKVADPLVTLAAAAAVTERVELGTCVLIAPLHLPFALARSLAGLDALSEGRLLAGLGTGWSIDEFAATAPRPFEERGAALDEFLDVAAAAWGPDPVSLDTGRYSIAPSEVNPKPARRLPIYLAGSNKTAFKRIAKRADGWLPTAVPPAPAVAAFAQIRQMAAAEGRDPASISCIYQVSLSGPIAEVPAEGRQPFTGSVAQLVDDIAVLAEGGVEHVYVPIPYYVRDKAEAYEKMAELHDAVRAAKL